MSKGLWRMSLLAALMGMSSAHAKITYDLSPNGPAATVAGISISPAVLDVMFKVSSAKKPELSRAAVLNALIENQLMGQYGIKRFGKANIVEDNKVSFKPAILEEQEFRAIMQIAFAKPLGDALKQFGGKLDSALSNENPIKASEWDTYLPSNKVMQLEFALSPTGKVAAAKRVLVNYRFDDKNTGVITFGDVYDSQNVQGRDKIHSREGDYVSAQARELVVNRYIEYWTKTSSGLTAADIASIKLAITNKTYHDGFASYIGIAADIHDDVPYVKSLAAKVSAAEIKEQLISFKPDYLVVFDDSFNYLSKMCLTIMREACFELIEYGKAAGCKVLVNSSDATDHVQLYLEKGADIVIKGEGELTLHELITSNCTAIENCCGIAYLNNGTIITTPKRPVLTQLDILPQPAWDLIDIQQYKNIWLKAHQKFSLNIATTRGCPFKCNWCAKPIYGNRYNSRTPVSVVEELKLLMNNFGATHFWVCDDIFGLKPGWVEAFSELLKKENLQPKLKIQCRADLLLTENTIQHLINAGLDEVWMGAESGSQQILDAMDKGTQVEQIAEATQLLKKFGVKVCFFLQYGYLGETKNDIDKTLNMVQDRKSTRLNSSH